MKRPEEQLWIMVDVETSGPIYGRHSMTELGAAAGSAKEGVLDRFEAVIRPIGDEVVTSRDSFEKAKAEGVEPAEAMRRFAAFARPFQDRGAAFIARPAAFDWPWIVYYAWTYLGENPFGFRALCASSMFLAHGRRFQVDLPHRAVDDAEIQLRHLVDAIATWPGR
jgi:DNA polymerase III epsilon subunit-like protein